MGVPIGLLVLFIMGAGLTCDAGEVMTSSLSSGETMFSDVSVLQISHQESEGEVQASKVGGNENVCSMCIEFAGKAIEYFKNNKTQTEIISILHKSCSRLTLLEQQCITLVDYYGPLLFLEIESVQPGDLCQKVNLCEQRVIISPPVSEDKCEICHHAITEVLLKLRDPNTQLDILQMLLKACDSVENFVKKCKILVLEYEPLMLNNAVQFLESTDICTAIHACTSTVDVVQALPIERETLISVI
ncbi:Saposin-D like [Actinidia chinensis var. chinensis]|uniref:Pulmonary surfactant-associated protein B n=1 Tax=Actinidia chinensis var. chinensis TaxID=1590841 RepID=A0A2R6R8L8_ACTCC|nr:Saposin-D like [Actinidia chinensis var. chinensis]